MSVIRRKILARLLCLSVLFSSLSLAAEPFPEGVSGRLFSVQGSNTVGASLMKSLLTHYLVAKGATGVSVTDLEQENEYRVSGEIHNRHVYVDVGAHGSSTGFRALVDGDAEIAMSSRPIKPGEVSQLAHYGDALNFTAEHVIAIDGLAVIVHRNNPVKLLNLEQIAGVFSGAITNWKDLGGADLPINLYARDENSGTWDTFASLVLGKAHTLSEQARRFESNDQLSDLVSRDAGGIGFVGLASVREAQALRVYDEGTLPLLPEHLTVATEDYALSRRLFLYTPPGLANAVIANFIAFVQSDAGQQQVGKTGFISQALTAMAPDTVRRGPADYLEATSGAERLSVNFRFAEGSAALDNKAQQDIRRVVAYMSRAENRDKQLTLIGFGDQHQTENRALVLSRLRAVTVKIALHKAGVATRPVEGFGAFMPVASNDGADKLKNRRVELWVRTLAAAPTAE